MLDIEKHLHLIQSLSFKPDGEVQVFFRDLNEWPEEQPICVDDRDYSMRSAWHCVREITDILESVSDETADIVLWTNFLNNSIRERNYGTDFMTLNYMLSHAASESKNDLNKKRYPFVECIINQCIKDIQNADN